VDGPGAAMKRTYAVVWGTSGEFGPGRLEPLDDRFELHGRDRRLSIPFLDVVSASIARGHAERLRGLPVLALDLAGGASVRIASLEGTAALHELVEHAGVTVSGAGQI
jgi:hypothetical protein